MLVYRVEMQDGEGPYGHTVQAASGLYEAIETYCMWGAHHPNPTADGIAGFQPGRHHCGFSTPEALLDWFDQADVLSLLEEAQFACSIYEVEPSRVIAGKRQVVFERDAALLTGRIPLSALRGRFHGVAT